MKASAHPNRGSSRATLITLYVVLAAYALITLMPFIWMLITSFKEPRDVFKLPPSFVPKLLFSDDPFAVSVQCAKQWQGGSGRVD